MKTIADLYPLAPKPAYLAHLKKLGEAIRAKQNADARTPDADGGFFKSDASTPAATRNEGIVAGVRLLAGLKDPLADPWLETARRIAAFELRCQFADENVVYLREPAKALGGFKKSLTDDSMRIDYTQHNVSALLGCGAS